MEKKKEWEWKAKRIEGSFYFLVHIAGLTCGQGKWGVENFWAEYCVLEQITNMSYFYMYIYIHIYTEKGKSKNYISMFVCVCLYVCLKRNLFCACL